jgi:hypothetical protein
VSEPLRGGDILDASGCWDGPAEFQNEVHDEEAEEEHAPFIICCCCVLCGDGGLRIFLRRWSRFHSSWTHFVNSSRDTFGVASRKGDVADGEDTIAPQRLLLLAVICSGLFDCASRSKLWGRFRAAQAIFDVDLYVVYLKTRSGTVWN